MNVPISTFEDGLAKIVNAILAARKKPFIVSIHGVPNSGKTELRMQATRTLATAHKVYGGSGMCGDSRDKMLFTAYLKPQYVIIEDLQFTERTVAYSTTVFGKKPDMKVFIAKEIDLCDDLLTDQVRAREYAFLIENPQARNKHLH